MAKRPKKRTKRIDDISGRPEIQSALLDVYKDVEAGFRDQHERADEIVEYWQMYNCRLSDRQFYNGDTEIFVPIVPDAIKARTTRFINQAFPQSGRYVDVTAVEADIPQATMALLENYVRQAKLRTEIGPALLTNGDVEGQYSIYVDWQTRERYVTSRVRQPLQIMGVEMPELGETEDFVSEVIVDAWPSVEVIADNDLMVLPVTAESINEALGVGGSVTVIRRWTKERVRAAVKAGDITEEAGDALVEEMGDFGKEGERNTGKQLADAAGIKDRGKHALVYETWTKLKVDGESRLCRAYFGSSDSILGCKLNPFWCDECPVISVPVEKVANVFKGRAPIANVADLQVLANDIANESADTGHFSAMPIVATDPEKNPRVNSMVLAPAAVWETSPNDTAFMQFPDMWMTLMQRVMTIKEQIFQSLGVNPAMMPQGTGGDSKRNQAEIANEQQVDILTTADAVTRLEEGILTPMIQRFASYDSQFRDETITVKVYGEMGLKANMEEVEPLQLNRRFEFTWLGVEAARNAAQMQQQIAGLNVFKGIPPQMYAGYTLQLAPIMIRMAEGLFGPRLAPLIFKKDDPISVPVEVEDMMLQNGLPVLTHPADDDAQHLQAHMALMQGGPMADPTGNIQGHIAQHQAQMQAKAMQQQQTQMGGPPEAPGLPGTPGGAGPGVAGAPKPGAQAMGPNMMKSPDGTIPQDQMGAAGAVVPPRQT